MAEQNHAIIWTYSMNLHQVPPDVSRLVDPPDVTTWEILDTLTGTVEARNYQEAYARAWNIVSAEIQVRTRKTTYGLGMGDLHVTQQNDGEVGE